MDLSVTLPTYLVPTSHAKHEAAFSMRENYDICLEHKNQLAAGTGKKLKLEDFGLLFLGRDGKALREYQHLL